MSNQASSAAREGPLLRVRALSKRYHRRYGWRVRESEALAAVDLDVQPGATMAIVGDSGAGKSTLARCIARLDAPDAGEIWFQGADLAQLSGSALRAVRPQVQLIFQDATTALNPRFSAEDLIAEPLLVQGWGNSKTRRERACELMAEVGLPPERAGRRAGEFSGGQQQRLAIARALALQPRLLILDEALTGLDLSTEAQIASLLLDLQQAHGLTYLLISHDIALVAHFADEVAVMSGGRIVERGPVAEVIQNPQHAATQAMVSAARGLQQALVTAGGRP